MNHETFLPSLEASRRMDIALNIVEASREQFTGITVTPEVTSINMARDPAQNTSDLDTAVAETMARVDHTINVANAHGWLPNNPHRQAYEDITERDIWIYGGVGRVDPDTIIAIGTNPIEADKGRVLNGAEFAKARHLVRDVGRRGLLLTRFELPFTKWPDEDGVFGAIEVVKGVSSNEWTEWTVISTPGHPPLRARLAR